MTDIRHPDTPRNRGDYNAPHVSPVTPAEDLRTIMINNISWGAVGAGVVVSLVAHLILNMIGIGLAAGMLQPTGGAADNPSVSTLSIGAGIWWAVAGVVAALAGGFVAGRLAGKPKESTAGWHGLTAWALTTLVIFYLVTSTAGGILSNASRTAGAALSNAPAMSATDPFGAIERTLREGGAAGSTDPQQLRDAAIAAVRAAVTANPAQAQEARERASQAVSRAQGVPVEQARTQVQQWEQQYRQAAETATTAASRGALIGALSLLLGALAGWFGGRMGASDPTITA